MREIKFRMWDPIKRTFNKCLDYSTFDIKITLESIEDGLITQYTGLKDKNGKEIYEGDLVRFKNSEVDIIGPLEWRDGFCLVYENIIETLRYCNCFWFEVIGNIWENDMRYFACEICKHEDVGQSDMSAFKASICESCRLKHRDMSKKLDERQLEYYRNKEEYNAR